MEIDDIEEGWAAKPKGLLQILWERGFIKPGSTWTQNRMDGIKDVYGNVDQSTALKTMMESCQDFYEEETLLVHYGRELGVMVLRTPKCHCELAGEGIEYCWGLAKLIYRKMPISKKKGKDSFLKSVREALSTDILTKERTIKFSKRARQYMLAYHSMEGLMMTGAENSTVVSHETIEKIVKQYKTHWCASDFDTGFIGSVVKGMLAIKVEE